ncbi:MAG: prolipoprotein diacylglyceryl transferase [Bacteroidia bacterium]|nr:prolipoprotein diacylglyceryl transferase [Bacteroidia bacterium]
MQFPFNIHIGKTEISTHLVTELLAFFIGYRYYSYLRKKNKDSISDLQRLFIIAGAAGGALIGSRLLALTEDPRLFMGAANKVFFIFGNKTVVGGMLGGLIGVELVKKLIKVKTSSGDMMTYPIILALIIGRIGCFAEGLKETTYGKATSLFTGIDFGDGIKRHPLQLYEIFVLICIWIMIRAGEKKFSYEDGTKFKLFMAFYLLQRFCFEFIKPNPFLIAGFSSIQLACFAGMLYYWKVFVKPFELIKKRNYA